MAKRNAKPNPVGFRGISMDAFVEAVLDCMADEALVCARLGLRPSALHDWMARNHHAVALVRTELEERDLDLSEANHGWLRNPDQLAPTPADEQEHWRQYQNLLKEEALLEAQDTLKTSMDKTNSLVARLQAEKRQRTQKAAARPKQWPREPEDD